MNRQVIILIVAACTAVLSCTDEIVQIKERLPEPQVRISDVTSTSFSASWDIVDDAGSYTYIFEDDTVVTKDRLIFFEGLIPDTEYSLSVRTDPGYNGSYSPSGFVDIHVITNGETQLVSPEPELIASYRSKTIIRWASVYGADSYEYTIGDKSGKTEGTTIELGGLEGNTEYVFRIKAVSSRPYVNPSPEAQLTFTTRPADDDMPQIIIDYIESGADYVNFNIYALPDCGYFYFAVPAVYFTDHTDEEVQEIYRSYVVEAIKDAGYALASGIATLSSYGSANYTEYPLYPEMTYYIVAFGLDQKGQVSTPMYKKLFKTIANDDSSGPDIAGADWFLQNLFLATFGGYNPSNCIWAKWAGKDVTDVHYLLTSTYSYDSYFESSPELFRKYIIRNGSKVEDDETLEAINSGEGLTSRFSLSPAMSYTMGTVAVNSAGDSTFVVSSMATKASPTYYDWVFLELGTSLQYPTESALVATVSVSYDATEALNIQVSEGGFYFSRSSELEGVSADSAGALVEEKGTPFTTTQIKMLNMTGRISMSFGTDGTVLEPGTKYTLIVSLKSTSGDKVVRFITASTSGEPADTRSLGLSISAARHELRHPVVFGNLE